MSLITMHADILGERRNWIIPRRYTELLDGDFVAAQVLKECVYWTAWSLEQHPDREGWFYRTEAEWKREAGVSRKQVVRAIGKINAIVEGTIERTRRSIHNTPMMHFRVDEDRFITLMGGECILPNGTNATSPMGQMQPAQRAKSLHTQVTPPDTTPVKTHTRSSNETDEFAAFYDAYPRKKARADAWRAWRTLKPDPALIETIMAALAEQIRVNWHDTDPRYIPYPASWIRAERWKDEIEAPRPKPAANRVVADHAETDHVDWFGKYGGQQ